MEINQNLKPEYGPESPPDGFDQLCAFHYPDGEIGLDFVNHERCDFASEIMDVELEWPWIDGFKPTDKDWQSIGFFVLHA